MRYLGSKESLTEPIIQLLAEKRLLQRNLVFFDAFCGMGSVSDAIKSLYDHIVINDSLKCSSNSLLVNYTLTDAVLINLDLIHLIFSIAIKNRDRISSTRTTHQVVLKECIFRQKTLVELIISVSKSKNGGKRN